MLEAAVERRVGGYVMCEEAVGVLLRVAPQHVAAFAAVRAHYFAAAPAGAEKPREGAVPSMIRTLSPSRLTPKLRRSLESALSETLARELPRVQSETAQGLANLAAGSRGYPGDWARARLGIENAMRRGEARLKYDAQVFRLSANAPPVYFVRAEWLVGRRQGFAASLWLRGERELEVLEVDVRPARWLRSSLFAGGVRPAHLALILNVLDRDNDGWGEVLFAWEGYEGRSISLREYSSSGFQPIAAELKGGC